MGTIVSNTDRGIGTYKDANRPMAYDDNNHGSIEFINGQWVCFFIIVIRIAIASAVRCVWNLLRY